MQRLRLLPFYCDPLIVAFCTMGFTLHNIVFLKAGCIWLLIKLSMKICWAATHWRLHSAKTKFSVWQRHASRCELLISAVSVQNYTIMYFCDMSHSSMLIIIYLNFVHSSRPKQSACGTFKSVMEKRDDMLLMQRCHIMLE